MSIDLRVKHDLESRRRAVELFDAGVGCKPAAEALSVPRETVREWQWVYRAFGSEALLSMGGKQSSYTFEQRVAAASAVVDGGMAKADAMAEFGIRSKSPLERWCRLYREGGAEALRPRPKGRPRGSRSTFENVIARDFGAEGPWQKLGTDVTEFKVAGAKAYWAPVLDFCTKEIVASDISTSPDLAQQHRMLDRLLEALPDGAAPTMHSDMGWQYQHESYTSRLEGAGITQSMSRKGNCIDNAATEQLFGHVKDEFYRGREWGSFGDFKRDLEEYIAHWNARRRQVRLKGLTPEEFRNQALAA